MKPVDFLDREGQEMVVNAIREAEKNTSGEIRVHIDDVCETDAYEKAVEVFRFLGMDRTAEKNAVLIYVACNSKVFAIVGDKGINEAVPEHFWTDIISMVRGKFAEKKFAEGLAEAIMATGVKLSAYFPYRENDVNEQPDEISYKK